MNSRKYRIFAWAVLVCVTQFPYLGQLEAQNSDDPSRPIEAIRSRQKGVDWPTFLGPTGDGVSPETGILKDWSDGNLKVRWTAELGEGYGIGSVSEGRYFQFDRHDEQARVRCFDAETGELIWNYQYPSDYTDLYGYDSGPRASPVVDGDRVYVYGVEGELHCLSADQGKRNWSCNVNEQFGVVQNFFGVASTPVIYRDLLLVMVGGSPPESRKLPPGALDRVQPAGSGVVAFDKRTGNVRYQGIDDLASYTSIKLARKNNRDVAYAWMRESLHGFYPETGELFLSFPYRARMLESVNASTPVVSRNQVFLSECYQLGGVLLKLNDGPEPDVVWSDRGRRDQAMATHWNTPILVDGYLYGCSGRHAGSASLRCVEWETGKVQWSNEQFSRSSLTFVDGHFVMHDERGRLVLFQANPNRFEPVTEFDGGPQQIRFRAPCWAAPVISDGLMYVRGARQLVCFELIPRPR